MKSGSPTAPSDVKFALLFLVCAVFFMSLWLAADRASAQEVGDEDDNGAAEDQYSASQNQYSNNEGSDDTCPNPAELFTIESQTENQVVPFEATGRTFRVNYSVEFMDDDALAFNSLEIDIEDDIGLVDFEIVSEDQEGSFIVTEGAGSYELVTSVAPDDGAAYTVSIEDCVDGATDDDDGDRQNDVVPGTTPNKPLANTGGETVSSGAPIVAALLGAAALFGVFGATMLRLGRRWG